MQSTHVPALAPTLDPVVDTLPSRLRPALIDGRRVHLDCPLWCVDDHVAENERHLEDVTHSGAMTDLVVPGGPGYRLLAHARLGSDPFASTPADRGPYVVVDDQSEPFILSPAEALVLADRLESFAARVRDLAVVATAA